MQNKPSRRDFLSRSSQAATALTLGMAAAPRTVLGAGDRIRLGFIGIGNRGSHDLRWMLPEKDVQFVAACDPNKGRREAVKRISARPLVWPAG